MASQLQVFNESLRLIGSLQLDTITDTVEARYVLDDAWDRAVTFVLRQASWKHALKTESLTGSVGSVLPGFTYKFSQPATWLRTNAIFVHSGTRECPVDVRQQDTKFYAHETPIVARYVSSDGDDPALWPEQFAKTVAAYLAFEICERLTGDAAKANQVFQLYQRQLGDAMQADAVPEDFWLPHQLDGSFAQASRQVLELGLWRFALKTVTPTSGGTAVAGFSTAYPKPADWLKTQSVFVVTGSKECPVDCREQEGHWSANEAIRVRYLSNDYLDSITWPEEFSRVVAARLVEQSPTRSLRRAQGDEIGESQQSGWTQLLQVALAGLSMPPSPWLPKQFDGSFYASARYVLEQGGWRFALQTATITASGTAQAGFSRAFPKPADFHTLVSAFVLDASNRECPVDMRDAQTSWSAATPSTSLVVRYVSTDGLDATVWSDTFTRCIAAHLGINLGDGAGGEAPIWPEYIKAALAIDAVPFSPWLQYQLDGSFAPGVRAVLENGLWRFAVKTVTLADNVATPSAGFDYAFDKPSDWIRTIHIYSPDGDERKSIEYRDEGGDLHANFDPIVLRYVSKTLGEDSTGWPDAFEHVVLAYLAFRHALGTPGAPVEAKRAAYEALLKQTQIKDEMRERPRMNRTGSFINARLATVNREQGV